MTTRYPETFHDIPYKKCRMCGNIGNVTICSEIEYYCWKCGGVWDFDLELSELSRGK